MMDLSASVLTLGNIGPLYSARLKRLNIIKISDLLSHLPYRYEDYTVQSTIASLQAGEKVTVCAKIVQFKNIFTKFRKQIQKVLAEDHTGQIEFTWYNQPFLKNVFGFGKYVNFSGKVVAVGNKITLENPDYEIINHPIDVTTTSFKNSKPQLLHTGRLVPIYPETAGLSSKWLRAKIAYLLFTLKVLIKEILPQELIKQYDLLSLHEAYVKIHFPADFEDINLARQRLSFDELFILELTSYIRKKQWARKTVSMRINRKMLKPDLDNYISKLPFSLTRAQLKATEEILADLEKSVPMNRLLEGDVGSGKTVVAAIAMLTVKLTGFKSLLMAPTEILAKQHYETITSLLSSYQIKIKLQTSAIKSAEKNNKSDILIGTHALLFNQKDYTDVGLIVIDEQQRFGVEQRALLLKKSNHPHVLSMSATPIPRTVALILYSDLSLSVLDEMPKGRLLVKTWVIPESKRQNAYDWIKKLINNKQEKNQAFIVCPFIDESDSLQTVKAAKKEYENLSKNIFPDLNLGLLHGKMSVNLRHTTLSKFQQGKIDILISTPVIEVGIDMPQATIMVIEAADRFGLAQLHQLRGRVGRGEQQSYCLLFTQSANERTRQRLKFLEKIYNGPKLAQLDLKLRGSGEIFGIRQHGNLGLKIADITDMETLNKSKEAISTFANYGYKIENFPLLRDQVQKYTIKQIVAN